MVFIFKQCRIYACSADVCLCIYKICMKYMLSHVNGLEELRGVSVGAVARVSPERCSVISHPAVFTFEVKGR